MLMLSRARFAPYQKLRFLVERMTLLRRFRLLCFRRAKNCLSYLQTDQYRLRSNLFRIRMATELLSSSTTSSTTMPPAARL